MLLTDFMSFQKYSLQPFHMQCGKAANYWRMEKSGNIRTCSDCSDCSREDNLIAWRSNWKHWGDPYLKANWQWNRVTVAYISVLFKRCYVADNVEHFSHFLVGFLFRYGKKKFRNGRLKDEHQCTWLAKFYYPEQRWSVKIAKYFYSKFAKLKSRENKW